MSARLRLVGVVVEPHIMLDDGENLTPVKVEPMVVPAADAGRLQAVFDAALEQLRQQVEGPSVQVVRDDKAV